MVIQGFLSSSNRWPVINAFVLLSIYFKRNNLTTLHFWNSFLSTILYLDRFSFNASVCVCASDDGNEQKIETYSIENTLKLKFIFVVVDRHSWRFVREHIFEAKNENKTIYNWNQDCTERTPPVNN